MPVQLSRRRYKRMKKIITTILTLVVMLFAGCGAEEVRYPLEDLDSSGINTEGLAVFKEKLYNAEILDCEKVAFRIGFRDGFSYLTVFELDETGMEINSHPVDGTAALRT